ncbi:hypothetical protein Nit79A3_2422 [Nitrosomonas sp. Is79A3]
MSTYEVAHIHEQGQHMIIIPLNSNFAKKTQDDQIKIKNSLQACANDAKLKGVVVPVWKDGNNMMFIAPPNWHAFYKSVSWDWVITNLNKTLTCH